MNASEISKDFQIDIRNCLATDIRNAYGYKECEVEKGHLPIVRANELAKSGCGLPQGR